LQDFLVGSRHLSAPDEPGSQEPALRHPPGRGTGGVDMGNVARIMRSQVGTATVVRLEGEHDLATSPELIQTMKAATRTHGRVVIDLTGATFIDSTVLRAITTGASESEAFAIVAPEGTPPRRL